MIVYYFDSIEKVLSNFNEIVSEQLVKKKLYNDTQGVISGNIIFIDGSELSFLELVDIEMPFKQKYKYQYMDKSKSLLFRYDNSKHYPDIESFPHHKHTYNSISASSEPELFDVLIEIQGLI
jgi:hypothetical protein